MHALALYCRGITALNRWIMIAATGLIAIMVAAICYEVIARYAFDAPTVWAMELARLLLGPYFLLAGPYLLHIGGHVNVDIVYAKLPERAAKVVDLLTVPVILYFGWVLLSYSLPLTITSFEQRETSTSAWNPQIWPAKAVMPMAFALLIAQAVAEWLRALFRVLRLPDPAPAPPPEPEARGTPAPTEVAHRERRP